jgi:hypothetical protein
MDSSGSLVDRALSFPAATQRKERKLQRKNVNFNSCFMPSSYSITLPNINLRIQIQPG